MKSVYAIALITAVCLFGDSMLYVALPTHYHEVGVSSLLEVGVLLSVNRLVRLPLNPVIGYLYRTISPRQGILMAVVLAGVTTSLYGVAKGFWIWVIIRAIWGLAWSFFKIGAFLLILNFSDDTNRGSLMGKYNGLYRLGSLVGMLAGGFFADQFGIGTISLVFGITAFLAIPAVLRYIPTTHGTVHQRQSVSSFETKPWWLDSRVLWILASGLLGSMALDGLLTATLSHVIVIRYPAVVKWLGLTMGASTLAGTMQAVRWLVGPWISPWIGRLSDRRWRRTQLLAFTLGIATLLMGMIPVRTPFVIWLILIFILLLVSSLVSTLSDSVASDTASASSAVAVMTTYAMALDVGAAIGPTLGYGLEALLGTSSMYWGSTMVLACLTIKWAWTAWSNRKQSEIHALSM
ncbi:MFS transporter [Alicyclobacillus dauci]|uniref:MFS transporter n=1 Tax=Alicyclobacillus dauci TaxID=1475485 RepID=A0ABY6Z797_9BACL|nr:MFS transporter [Alicyclobacillus dauci]WAH38129.1 MFS transporter [Alicyclobacillus dauci]